MLPLIKFTRSNISLRLILVMQKKMKPRETNVGPTQKFIENLFMNKGSSNLWVLIIKPQNMVG